MFCAELQKKLATAQQQTVDAKSERDRLRAQLSAANQQVVTVNSENAELREQLTATLGKIEGLTSTLKAFTELQDVDNVS